MAGFAMWRSRLGGENPDHDQLIMMIMMVVVVVVMMVVMAAIARATQQYNNDRRCATEIYPGVREVVDNEVDESRRMIDSRIGALHSEVTFTW